MLQPRHWQAEHRSPHTLGLAWITERAVLCRQHQAKLASSQLKRTSADLQHGYERFRPLVFGGSSSWWYNPAPARATAPLFTFALHGLQRSRIVGCARARFAIRSYRSASEVNTKSGDETDCLVATRRSASPCSACPSRMDRKQSLSVVCRRVHTPHLVECRRWFDLSQDRFQ